jgi:hypothetical protein
MESPTYGNEDGREKAAGNPELFSNGTLKNPPIVW